MRLTDLNPRWFAEEGRQGQGVTFDCPHCVALPNAPEWQARVRLAVAFDRPLDGGAPCELGTAPMTGMLYPRTEAPGQTVVYPGVHWGRVGDTFETLTLTPSVDASRAGHWHGFIRNGAIS